MIKTLLATTVLVLSTISIAHSDDYIKPTNKFIVVSGNRDILLNTNMILKVDSEGITLVNRDKIPLTSGADTINALIYGIPTPCPTPHPHPCN